MKCGNCQKNRIAKSTHAAERKRAARRSPANQRRQRAGNRADGGRKRRARLERRVQPEIQNARRAAQRAPRASSPRAAATPRRGRSCHAENQHLARLQRPGRQRARGRAAHHRVHFALDVLIQRGRAAGNQQVPHKRVQQERPIERPARAEIKARDRGDHHEKSDVRLGERRRKPTAVRIP